jgi:hypothetical protein
MAFTHYDRSIPEIIGDMFGQFGALLRKESQLAKAELSEKLGEAGLGVGLLAASAILAIPALVLLLEAGAAAINDAGLSPAVSALIVGAVALVVAIVLAVVGMSRLKVERLTPKRTLRQLQKDADLAMQRLRANGHDRQRAA